MVAKSKVKGTRTRRLSPRAKEAMASEEAIKVPAQEVIRLLQVIAESDASALEHFKATVTKRGLSVQMDADFVNFVGAYVSKHKLGKPTSEGGDRATTAGARAKPLAARASRPVGDRFNCF